MFFDIKDDLRKISYIIIISSVNIFLSHYFSTFFKSHIKQLVAGINATNLQTKIYQDTLKLIAVGKSKLVQELKKV